MLTLLVASCFTILAAAASSEDNQPNAALEWQPVSWFMVYSSATLLLLLAMVTCATRRERTESKGLLGVDLVERGVLHGERSAGLCEWLARRWPWAPAPQRTPQLSQLRMGLARSTHPLLCYELVEKRHVHTARGAVCVIRTDLQELQEQAEKENMTRTPRGSTESDDVAGRMSYDSQRGSSSGSPTEQLRSVVANPIVELGTVKPLESDGQPLFRTVKPFGYSGQHVSWSQPALNITSNAEFLEEGRITEPLPEDISTESVVITGDSNQSRNQINETNYSLDVKNREKWGTEGKTTRISETADTVGRDESDPSITITGEITQASDHDTSSKKVIKPKSYIDVGLNAEEANKYKGNQYKQNLLSQHKMKSTSDLEQSSESDTLGEISVSSDDDFSTYLPSYKQSQDKDFMLLDNTKLGSPTDDPKSLPSQDEVPTATDNTTTQTPSVYISVLDKDASKLPKHTSSTEELEDTDNVIADVSSCFLHPVAPHSQEQFSQFSKRIGSKSVQNIYLPPEKEYSVQHLQYWHQTEYKLAPVSDVTTNNTAFSASKAATKWPSAKISETSIIAEEVPGLKTSWDLLHSFPCHIDTVKMLRMDTTSEMNPVSDSYSAFKQHDEHSIYQRRKGYGGLATKQQESCNKEEIVSDSRHKRSRADQRRSTVQSFRYARKQVSYSETTTKQQHCPLTTTTNAGEHFKVLQWRITVSPHLQTNNKKQTKNPQ